jgi:hypothetical protein
MRCQVANASREKAPPDDGAFSERVPPSGLRINSEAQQGLSSDLNPHAGSFQFNARLTLVLALLFTSFPPTLGPNLIPIPVGRFDALLFANARRTLLSTHAIGVRRRGQQSGRGHYDSGDRKSIGYHPHEYIL